MYRLRSNARFHCLPGGKAALVLQFPLRAAFIPDIWHPVLKCLGSDAWVPLDRISATAPHIPVEKIELFLNSLIRKGYIDQEGYPLLAGARGQEGVDENAIAEIMTRLSQMLMENPEIEELDFNPVMAFPAGGETKIVDARISVKK